MTHIEAMKQWLEALEYIDDGANNQGAHTGISWRCVSNKAQPAIASLRQAIAEAEKQDGVCQHCAGKGCVACDAREQEPVIDKSAAIRIATALGWEPKREWVGLTDEERYELANVPRWSSVAFVEATEQALKEKNT